MEQYLVSARKYRPRTFASVVGQKDLTTTLKNAVASGRLAHSYLFCGSRGVGKTSCARIFAKTINCEHPTSDGEACNECTSCRDFNSGTSMNIVELDAASNNGIEGMRMLIDQVQVPPSIGRYRVFIVDEVHMLSTSAFNAFLKTLEEPPEYVVFILATTEKHKIIPTILSRCQIYDFKRITIPDMVEHLQSVAQAEGITADKAALGVIASKADGAMRDALSIFDQIAAASGGNITYASAIENLNVLDSGYYHRMLDAFLDGDVLKTWLIYKEIRDHGFDSQFLINGLAAYLRDLMVARQPETLCLLEEGDEAKSEMARKAARCTPEFLYKAMSLCNDADLNYRAASNKQILVEILLAKICQLLSPSPSNDGNGEGQLKPIVAKGDYAAAMPAPSAAPQQKPASTTASTPTPASTPAAPARPQAHPAPAPTASQPAAAAPAPPVRPKRTAAPTLGVPHISIRNGNTRQATNGAPAAAAANVHRSEQFSAEALNTAWETYIHTHPTAHILINTMRASPPKLLSPTKFVLIVQNQIQLDMLEANRQELLRYIHDKLQNDDVDFTIELNQGTTPRYVLNDRELLETMRKESPALEHLIAEFKLRLS